MTAVLEHVGIPQAVCNLVAVLYLGHACKLAAAGELLDGFAIRAGIRQGCPLSPLLFAICGDLLLSRLSAALPADTMRAYADDLALVSKDIRASAAVFGSIFGEFALLFGLGLNLRRTVFVPPW